MIAHAWAKNLPTFQLWKKMCDAYENSELPDRAPPDDWGTPLRVVCDRQKTNYVLLSAGPDRRFGTRDDIETRQMSAPITVFREDAPWPIPKPRSVPTAE